MKPSCVPLALPVGLASEGQEAWESDLGRLPGGERALRGPGATTVVPTLLRVESKSQKGQAWQGGRTGYPSAPRCVLEVGGAPRERQWEACQACPLPQAPFPSATLTLGRVTAVIKIDLVSGEEGETGSQEAS